MLVDVQTFVLHFHQCGSGAVGNFPALFIVSLFMGIGRDHKLFSRREGRVAPPEMGTLPMSRLSVLGFNRSALGVKKVCSAI